MKNILFLTHILPYPADEGGKLGTASIINQLAKSGNVYLYSFKFRDAVISSDEIKNTGIRELRILEHKFEYDGNKKKERPVLYRSLFSRFPYEILKMRDKRMSEAIKCELSEKNFGRIYIDHIDMDQYLPEKYHGKKILIMHDISSILAFRQFRYSTRLRWKLFYLIEAVKYFFYELIKIPRYHYLYAVSEPDANHFRKFKTLFKIFRLLYPEIKILPFIPREKLFNLTHKNDANTILFIGNLRWYPNRQGIEWFLNEIYPLLIEKIPEIRICIVGKLPDNFPDKEYKNVTFTGYVKDTFSFYKKSVLFIAPIQTGSGIKIKVIEAAAAGLPIVTTPVGIEGIKLQKGKEIIVTDKPYEFADNIIYLLKNKRLRMNISSTARHTVYQAYFKNHLL